MIKTKIKNLQFQILVQSKTGGKSVSLKHDIQWKSFEDGWPNLFIENVKENCAGRDVIFLGSFHSPEVVFEQLSIVYNIPRYDIKHLP